MKKGENHNHPKKGSIIKVEPLKTFEDIEKIKSYLEYNTMYYGLFVIGINTNLRASDLVNLKEEQVRDLKPMDSFNIREKKTKKKRVVILNRACISAIKDILEMKGLGFCDYPINTLFLNTHGNPFTTIHLCKLVKKWCDYCGIKGKFGSHTLRKTWGYFQHKHFQMPLPDLMYCYNHSTQQQTLEYLCITTEEIKHVYANEL